MANLDKMAREFFRQHGGNPDQENTVVRAALAAIRAALLTAPPGWKLVPAEPTGEMLRAALRAPCSGHPETGGQSYPDIYRAMLAAAQEPEA